MIEEFTHRERFPSHDITYWTGAEYENLASDKSLATLARVEVRLRGNESTQLFKWPGEKQKVEHLCRMLQLAFERGDLSARADIRKCLGIAEVGR